jgi:enoyl-CoA hydratase/carnithine racemase
MVNHALLKNDAYSKPIVAAVNGDCVGGGLKLLLSTCSVWPSKCPVARAR